MLDLNTAEVIELLRDIRKDRAATAEAQQQKTVGFSSVGSTRAEKFLAACDVDTIDGAEADPISPPEGTPVAPTFDFAAYEDERAGAADCREYHQSMLARFGVPFGGRQGYEVCDLRDQATCLRFQVNGRLFSGTADCCLAPSMLLGGSIVRCMPVVFVHKQNEAQKDEYRRNTSGQAGEERSVESEPLAWAAEEMGYSVAVLLGALATCYMPAMVDLTDGTVHHLLQLRGAHLYVWDGLSPTQAYCKLANTLLAEPLPMNRRRKLEDLEETDDVKSLKARRCRIQVVASLKEQLDSVLPCIDDEDERFQIACDLIASHVASGAGSTADAGRIVPPYLNG